MKNFHINQNPYLFIPYTYLDRNGLRQASLGRLRATITFYNEDGSFRKQRNIFEFSNSGPHYDVVEGMPVNLLEELGFLDAAELLQACSKQSVMEMESRQSQRTA